jgi:pantetheine-phosphate adenylyltransferase
LHRISALSRAALPGRAPPVPPSPPAVRSRHALFPGTFDPPTLGHLDLVRRARALFGRVTVALAAHPEKRTWFGVDERAELWRGLIAALPAAEAEGLAVARLDGLVVDGATRLGCDLIVRGVRSGSDFDYEVQMARTNRSLPGSFETVLLVPAPEFAHISSTLVRQIAELGGDVSGFVPAAVLAAIRERTGQRPSPHR